MGFMNNSWLEAGCPSLSPAHLPLDLLFPKDLCVLQVVSFPFLLQSVFHLLKCFWAVTTNNCWWLLKKSLENVHGAMHCCRVCHRNLNHCGKYAHAHTISSETWAILHVGICISSLQMQQFCPQGACCDIFHTKFTLLLATSAWLFFSDFLLMSSLRSCYCLFL